MNVPQGRVTERVLASFTMAILARFRRHVCLGIALMGSVVGTHARVLVERVPLPSGVVDTMGNVVPLPLPAILITNVMVVRVMASRLARCLAAEMLAAKMHNARRAFALMEYVAIRRVRAHVKLVLRPKKAVALTALVVPFRPTSTRTMNAPMACVMVRADASNIMGQHAAARANAYRPIAWMDFAAEMLARERVIHVRQQNMAGTMVNVYPRQRAPIRTTNAELAIAMDPARVR